MSASFAELTTLRLGGPPRELIAAADERELLLAVRGVGPGRRLFVLGGGSNLAVADAGFDGTVVRVQTRGVRELARDGDTIVLKVAAGESWDALVADCVAAGYSGLEALSGIPGTVGAAPIQNIGAYGAAVAEHVAAVDVLNRMTRERLTLSATACRFGYRDSRFKREVDRYVVLGVRFKLTRRDESAPVSHRELAAQLGIEVGQRAPLVAVRDAVLAVRARKGMVLDGADHDTWSAGSFFVNPVLDAAAFDALARRARTLDCGPPPAYPEGGGAQKVPAAWLIEHAGFTKGYPLAQRPTAQITISTKHPLALTNRGAGTAAELATLAREIVAGVQASFGVRLMPEPRTLGFGPGGLLGVV